MGVVARAREERPMCSNVRESSGIGAIRPHLMLVVLCIFLSLGLIHDAVADAGDSCTVMLSMLPFLPLVLIAMIMYAPTPMIMPMLLYDAV
jgi:hypothetical protein